MGVDTRHWNDKSIRVRLIGTSVTGTQDVPTLTFDSVHRQIKSVSVQKRFGGPFGVLSMQLLPHGRQNDIAQHPWYEAIKPWRHLVVIEIQDEPVPAFVGFLDRVQEGISTSTTDSQRTLMVTGRDLGCLLTDDTVSCFPNGWDSINTLAPDLDVIGPGAAAAGGAYGSTIPSPVVATDRALANRRILTLAGLWGAAEVGKTPSEIIDKIISYVIALGVRLQDGSRVANYFDWQTHVHDRGEQVMLTNISMNNGSIYEACKKAIDPQYYHLWVESGIKDGKPVGFLRLRFHPFSPGDWAATRNWVDGEPYHRITDDDFIRGTFGRSNDEAISAYQTVPQYLHTASGNGERGETMGTFLPLVDHAQVARTGLRVFRCVVQNIPRDEDWSDHLTGLPFTQARNRLLHSWYHKNTDFERGDVVVKGRGTIRIGDRLYIPRRGMMYHVEGSTLNWSFGQPFTSTVSLTRGDAFHE